MRRERSHSDLSDLLSDFLRVFHSNYFYSEVGIFVNCVSVQWFSGKIQRCHRWAPSSILGWTICNSQLLCVLYGSASAFAGSTKYLVSGRAVLFIVRDAHSAPFPFSLFPRFPRLTSNEPD